MGKLRHTETAELPQDAPVSLFLQGESYKIPSKTEINFTKSTSARNKTQLSYSKHQGVHYQPPQIAYPLYNGPPMTSLQTNRPLAFYEWVYIEGVDNTKKSNHEISRAQTSGKIETNKMAVLLNTKEKTNGYIPSSLKIGKKNFETLGGSEKERCEKNFSKIQKLKEKLEREEDAMNRMRIAFAVFSITFSLLNNTLNLSQQRRC